MPHCHRNSSAFGSIRKNPLSSWNLGCLWLGSKLRYIHFSLSSSWVWQEGQENQFKVFIIIDDWTLFIEVDAIRNCSTILFDIILCWPFVFLVIFILIFKCLLIAIFKLIKQRSGYRQVLHEEMHSYCIFHSLLSLDQMMFYLIIFGI